MKNDKIISLCLKNCGCDISSPSTVAKSLSRIILLPGHKHRLLKSYCEENDYDYASNCNHVVFR